MDHRYWRREFSRRLTHPDVIGIAIIVLATTIFLAPALRPGYTLLPLGLERGTAPWNKQVSDPNTNLLLSDPLYEYYPFRNYTTAGLHQGEFRLWNPYILGGHPNAGDLLAQTFYPPHLIAQALFPLSRVWAILIWGHLTLTGLLMYGYLRQLRLPLLAALFGALAWDFNAVNIISIEIPHFLATLAWLPGVFWLLERARQNRRWRAVVGAGIAYGLMLLAGQIQHAIGAAGLIGLWALVSTGFSSRDRQHLDLWPLLAAGAAGLLGIGLGMLQLAPAIELLQLSHRAGTQNVSFQSWFVTGWPWRHLVTLWLPDFYGNPARYETWWWGEANIVENAAYFGLWPLVLAFCAPFWSRKNEGRFWGGIFWLTLLALLGTPVAHLLRWVPGISYVSLTRLLPFIAFTGSAAAAFGLEAARERIVVQPAVIKRGLGLVFAALALLTLITIWGQLPRFLENQAQIWPQLIPLAFIVAAGLGLWILAHHYPTPALALLVLLSTGELMAWGWPFNPVHSTAILYPENPITDWLHQHPGLYRVLPLQSDRPVFGPNILSVFQIQDPDGYTSQTVRRYRELGKALHDEVHIGAMAANPHMLVHSEFDPLFSLLNVRYILGSYQRPEQITVEVEARGCQEEIPLRPGAPVSQTFQVTHPGLNRIDLHFTTGTHPAAPLRFHLRRIPDGALLVEVPFSTTDISENGDYSVYFAAVPDSGGGTFTWELTAQSAPENLALCKAIEGRGAAFTAYSTQLRFADTLQGVWIYENPNALPRAYVSHHLQPATDEEALQLIREKRFDPWHAVLVAPPLAPELQALAETAPQTPLSPAKVVEYTPHRVVVQLETAEPGLLVLSDTWYPGWEAALDGRAAELLQVNYALRGVYVDRGAHRVEFRFRPRSVYFGLFITCGTLLLSISLVYLEWRKARTPGTAVPVQP